MGKNIAARRAAKAQRRKAVVAEKRRAEALEATLPARVLRAAEMPIQHCLLTDGLFEIGTGTLLLARGRTADYLTMGMFLLDVSLLGVKDVGFRLIDRETLETFMGATPMGPVDPSYGRKLLRDLVAWAQSIGFPPHRDFATAERLFGDVRADTCDVGFQFGRQGKPLLVSSPSQSPSQLHRVLGQLQERLGVGGFDYLVPVADAPAIDAEPPAEFVIVDEDGCETT
jgi:hypothetical protein